MTTKIRRKKKIIYEKIKWKSRGYGIESEIIANVGRHKLKYKEIPVETIYKDKFKGTNPLDGMRIFLNMLSWRLRYK